MAIYFISGHLDLTEEEFKQHYVPQLYDALATHNTSFIVCDAKGADTLAQLFLVQNSCQDITSLYHMFETPRNKLGNFQLIGGFTSDEERDSQATKDSHKDIAWVRPGREKSGTARNIKRRKNTTPLA